MFIDEDGNVDPVNVLKDLEVVEKDTILNDDNNSQEDLNRVDLNSNVDLNDSAYLQIHEEQHEADI